MESGILDFVCDRTQCPVFGKCDLVPTQVRVGSENPKEIVLFVGEAPGETDAAQGLPFMGRSGKLLRDTVRKLNTSGVSIAYTNLVRYHPQNEEDNSTEPPDPGAVRACLSHLKSDVDRIKPTRIVALGDAVLKALFPDSGKIASVRGSHLEHEALGKVFVSYSPAHVLRQQDLFATWRDDLQAALGSDENLDRFSKWNKPWKWEILDDIDKIEAYVDFLLTDKNIKIIAFDTETKNLGKRYGNVLGTFQFSHDGKNSVMIPYHHPESGFTIDEFKRLDAALIKLFTSPKPGFKYWVAHNMEFDFRMIMNFGLGVVKFNRPIMDTECLSYCLDENRNKTLKGDAYRLESLLRDYMGVDKYGDDPEIKRLRKQGRLLEVPIERLAPYGCSDAIFTYRLFFNILERAEKEGYKKKLLSLGENWFEPVTRMIAIMSSNGFWADVKQLRILGNQRSSPITVRMAEIKEWWKTRKTAIKANEVLQELELGGKMKSLFNKVAWVFDIDKNLHKACLFFDVMGLDAIDYGKGKRTVLYGKNRGQEVPAGKLDKAFQAKFTEIHEEVEAFHEHSGLKKLATSYVKSIFEFLDPRTNQEGSIDGRIRPSFWITSTDTGRSSCSKPNLQQVPRPDNWAKKEIKNMFAAEPGTALIQLDFMTSEVRWWGILAQCPSLALAFENGQKAREQYQKLSLDYCAKHPKMKFVVLDAGTALLDKTLEELKKDGKIPEKVLNFAAKALAKDPEFNELCEAKKFAGIAGDIHKSTASQMYQVPIEKVTKPQRTDTKTIVFGSMFGRGAKAIAQLLKEKDIDSIKRRIADFFSKFPAADAWFTETEEFAEQNGYVESPIGRRRRLVTFLLGLADEGDIARAKRVARNSPIQGISSDGAFLGAAMFSDWLIENDKWHVHPDASCWLIQNVVHDSLVLQVPLADVPEAIASLKPFFTTLLMKRMTDVWQVHFNINLEIEFELGLKWGDMKAWDGTPLHMEHMMNKLRKDNELREAA